MLSKKRGKKGNVTSVDQVQKYNIRTGKKEKLLINISGKKVRFTILSRTYANEPWLVTARVTNIAILLLYRTYI